MEPYLFLKYIVDARVKNPRTTYEKLKMVRLSGVSVILALFADAVLSADPELAKPILIRSTNSGHAVSVEPPREPERGDPDLPEPLDIEN